MRKIQKLFIVVAVLVLGLTGCSKEPVLSDTEALSVAETAWDNYKEMYDNIWVQGLGHGSIVESTNVADVLFYADGDIDTLGELMQEVEKVCTGEFAQTTFYEPYIYSEIPIYEELDGKLCMRPAAFSELDRGEIELISVAADKIQIKVMGEYNETTKLQGADRNVTLVLQDGSWLVSEIEIVK